MKVVDEPTTASRADEVRSGDDAKQYPVTRSGLVPCAVQPTRLTPAEYVARSVRLHDLLEELAQHLMPGESEEGLRSIADECAELDDIADQRPYGRVLIGFGEHLIDIGLPEHAESPLLESIALADKIRDVRLGADGRRTLGRARLIHGDPSCRKILEEALAMFKAVADLEAALDVACLLRASKAAVMELPCSRAQIRIVR